MGSEFRLGVEMFQLSQLKEQNKFYIVWMNMKISENWRAENITKPSNHSRMSSGKWRTFRSTIAALCIRLTFRMESRMASFVDSSNAHIGFKINKQSNSQTPTHSRYRNPYKIANGQYEAGMSLRTWVKAFLRHGVCSALVWVHHGHTKRTRRKDACALVACSISAGTCVQHTDECV